MYIAASREYIRDKVIRTDETRQMLPGNGFGGKKKTVLDFESCRVCKTHYKNFNDYNSTAITEKALTHILDRVE